MDIARKGRRGGTPKLSPRVRFVVILVLIALVAIQRWHDREQPVPGDTAGSPADARDAKLDDGVAVVSSGSGTIQVTDASDVPASASLASTAPLVVRILDVGQGDAILIENGGSRVLVDGGPDVARMGRLLDSLDLRGSTIDVVILTHPHFDHHAGLRALFDTRRRITMRYLFENLDPYDNGALFTLRDSVTARARRGELRVRDTDDPCGDGSALCTVELRGGARLHIMRPLPSSSDANERSVALKLVGPDSASFTMWMAGDAEREAIQWFSEAGYHQRPGMKANILKLDHHGSCDGITARYLARVQPDWAVASLASDNEYGYIHSQTTQLLSDRSIPWYRTDMNGTVTITSPGTDGGGYSITASRGSASTRGRMDRHSTQRPCRSM